MTGSANVSCPPAAPGFGLHSAPFADSAEDAFFFPSDQHLRALEFMGHALWTRARLGVVTAEHGCGKSFLIRRLLRSLDERILAAAVQSEQIKPREFLQDVLRQFGFALEENDKTDRRRLLERFLSHHAGTGRLCLLIVENPQSMSPSVLEELRCIAAVESDGARVLKVLLLGQPSLDLVLESPRMSELGASRAPRCTLGALTEDQTAAYVAHRLRAAGAPNPDALMPTTLMPQIHACTRGTPARINELCARALAVAVEEGEPHVTSAALDAALDQLGWASRRPTPQDGPSASAGEAAPRLIISMQGLADREVSLAAGRLLIGRGPEADIRIDSVFISRYH